jgi:hypothetical protein
MQVSLLSAIYCTTDEKAIFRGIASPRHVFACFKSLYNLKDAEALHTPFLNSKQVW